MNPQHEPFPDAYHDTYSRTVFGFWVFLLTDFILFGCLFATYEVLRYSTFGGPSAVDLTHPPFVLIQTLVLLCASFLVGLGGASAHRKNRALTILFFVLTFCFGVAFLAMEGAECSRLVEAGASWKRSANLSIFFTLIGTHAIHVLFGLLWIVVLLIPVFREGLKFVSIQRLTCLRMLWQFLNIIWIFIFTFVYLMGLK